MESTVITALLPEVISLAPRSPCRGARTWWTLRPMDSVWSQNTQMYFLCLFLWQCVKTKRSVLTLEHKRDWIRCRKHARPAVGSVRTNIMPWCILGHWRNLIVVRHLCLTVGLEIILYDGPNLTRIQNPYEKKLVPGAVIKKISVLGSLKFQFYVNWRAKRIKIFEFHP